MRKVQSRSAQGRRNIVVGTLVDRSAARVAGRIRPGPGAAARAGGTGAARTGAQPAATRAAGRARPHLRRRCRPDLHADQAGQDGGFRIGDGQAARGADEDRQAGTQAAGGRVEDLQVDRAGAGRQRALRGRHQPDAQGRGLHRGEDPVRGVSDRSADDLPDLPRLVCRRPEPHEPEPGAGFRRRRPRGQNAPAAPAPLRQPQRTHRSSSGRHSVAAARPALLPHVSTAQNARFAPT